MTQPLTAQATSQEISNKVANNNASSLTFNERIFVPEGSVIHAEALLFTITPPQPKQSQAEQREGAIFVPEGSVIEAQLVSTDIAPNKAELPKVSAEQKKNQLSWAQAFINPLLQFAKDQKRSNKSEKQDVASNGCHCHDNQKAPSATPEAVRSGRPVATGRFAITIS